MNFNFLINKLIFSNNNRFVLDVYKTEELVLLVVKINGLALQFVPKYIQTETICFHAIEKDFSAFRFVDSGFSNSKLIRRLAFLGVSTDGLKLRLLPAKFQTYEVCLRAVKSTPKSIQFISNECFLLYFNCKICIEAVSRDYQTLEFILNHSCFRFNQTFKDLICKLALENKKTAVVIDIPKIFHFYEPFLIKKSLKIFKNKKLIRLTIEHSPASLLLSSDASRFIKTKHCKLALKKVPQLFECMKLNQTLKLCYKAVESDEDSIIYIKDEFRTPEICLLAVKKNGKLLDFLRNHQTEELVQAALKQNSTVFEFVNEELKNEKLCLLAVSINGNNLKYISKQTPSICHTAVFQRPEAIKFVKKRFQTEQLCLYAVKQDKSLLHHVRKKRKLVVEAAKQDCF